MTNLYLETAMRLIEEGRAPSEGISAYAQISIAISLQRIAEALERQPLMTAGIWDNTREGGERDYKAVPDPGMADYLTPPFSFPVPPTMDWQQVALNGGPPCFYVETNTPDELPRYCGRAQRWEGHGIIHRFIPLAQVVKTISNPDMVYTEDGYVVGTPRGSAAPRPPTGDITPILERAVVRGALRQWARDRRTLDLDLLAACDDLQRHVGDATVYAKDAPASPVRDGITPPFSQGQVNNSLQILANLCDRHRRAKLPLPTSVLCEECTKEQGETRSREGTA